MGFLDLRRLGLLPQEQVNCASRLETKIRYILRQKAENPLTHSERNAAIWTTRISHGFVKRRRLRRTRGLIASTKA